MNKPRSQGVAARRLRRNQSDAEKRLWFGLRARQLLGVKFRRQQPIGRFTVDFCSLEPKLVIEVDGGQHAESVADEQRSAFLRRSGYEVLRFWNNEVLSHLDEVVERIAEAIEQTTGPAGETLESTAGESRRRGSF